MSNEPAFFLFHIAVNGIVRLLASLFAVCVSSFPYCYLAFPSLSPSLFHFAWYWAYGIVSVFAILSRSHHRLPLPSENSLVFCSIQNEANSNSGAMFFKVNRCIESESSSRRRWIISCLSTQSIWGEDSRRRLSTNCTTKWKGSISRASDMC